MKYILISMRKIYIDQSCQSWGEGEDAKGGKGDYHRIDGRSKLEFPSFSPRKCVFARGARGLVTETWFEAAERGQRRGLKIEKVGMEGGRTERSRRQLLRERESLFFCLEDQTSFCNRKFSTAASRETRPSRDDQRFLDKVKYWRVLREWRNRFSKREY